MRPPAAFGIPPDKNITPMFWETSGILPIDEVFRGIPPRQCPTGCAQSTSICCLGKGKNPRKINELDSGLGSSNDYASRLCLSVWRNDCGNDFVTKTASRDVVSRSEGGLHTAQSVN